MRKGSVTHPYVRAMSRTVVGPVIREDIGPCLDCTYTPDRDGYPHIWDNECRRNIKASRIVLAHALGRLIISGQCALHHCDRPSCIRASHLYEGTLSQNSIDRDFRKGNPCPKGSKHRSAKLSERDIPEIRRLYDARVEIIQTIANRFGVTGSVICQIGKRRAWKHVGMA